MLYNKPVGPSSLILGENKAALCIEGHKCIYSSVISERSEKSEDIQYNVQKINIGPKKDQIKTIGSVRKISGGKRQAWYYFFAPSLLEDVGAMVVQGNGLHIIIRARMKQFVQVLC